MEVEGQRLQIDLTKTQACESRDALAKALYGNLFNWIIEKINTSLNPKAHGVFIGILDIFGFENFKENSLEQLLINYANEKLQQHFIRCIFKLEQEEYQKEEIPFHRIDFMDNQDCLDLIEKKVIGVLPILDETGRFLKGTDESFLEKLQKQHSSHPRFSIPKRQHGSFAITHFAGNVEYSLAGFLFKNKDTLQQDLIDACCKSKNEFISQLLNTQTSSFKLKEQSSGNMGTVRRAIHAESVSSQFRRQLDELVNILAETNPSYVRCVSPNSKQTANLFDGDHVMNQLRNLGILETVRIRKQGFSTRIPHSEFLQRYGMLFPGKSLEEMISEFSENEHAVLLGKSKVFLKSGEHSVLEEKRGLKIVEKVKKIQSLWRSILIRRYFVNLRSKTVKIQSVARRWMDRRAYYRTCDAVVILQSFSRLIAAKKLARRVRLALTLQAFIRGKQSRDLYFSELEIFRKERQKIVDQEEWESILSQEKFLDFQLEEINAALTDLDREHADLESEVQIMILERDYLNHQRDMVNTDVLISPKKSRRAMTLFHRGDSEILDADDFPDNYYSSRQNSVVHDSRVSLPSFVKRPTFNLKDAPEKSPRAKSPERSEKRHSSISGSISERKKTFTRNAIPQQFTRSRQIVEPSLPLYQQVYKIKPALSASTKSTIRGLSVRSFAVFTDQEAAACPYQNFCSKNFAPRNKGKLKKRQMTVTEMMAFSAKKLSGPLLQGLDDRDSKTAMGVWEQILNFLENDDGRNVKSVTSVKFILTCGMSNSEPQKGHKRGRSITSPLSPRNEKSDRKWKEGNSAENKSIGNIRNEIYCQICKQLTANPDHNLAIKAWELMAMVTNCFPTTPYAVKWIANFLLEQSVRYRDETSLQISPSKGRHGRVNSVTQAQVPEIRASHSIQIMRCAQFCLNSFKQTVMHGARSSLPSQDEYNALIQFSEFWIIVQLADSRKIKMPISSWTSVGQILDLVSQDVNVSPDDRDDYGLIESYAGLERVMDRDEILSEILGKWENYASTSGQTQSFEILFKRLVFPPKFFQENQPTSVIDFYQCVHAVLMGTWACLPGTAITLGHVLYRYESEIEPPEELAPAHYIPHSLLYMYSADEWRNLLKEEAEKSKKSEKSEKSEISAKSPIEEYMEVARTLPLFGSSAFEVSPESSSIVQWNIPPHAVLSISYEGMSVLRPESKVPMCSFPWENVHGLTYTAKNLTVHVEGKPITMETMRGKDISNLIDIYKAMASKVLKEEVIVVEEVKPDKEEVSIPEQSPMGMRASLSRESMRRVLSNLGQDSHPIIYTGKFYLQKLWQSHFRIRSKKRGKDFEIEERLTYSPLPLQESLLQLSEDDEKLAIESFNDILKYSGEYSSSRSISEIAQNLIQSAIEMKKICDEFYIQLYKQTSHNPNPESLRRIWELIATSCGIVLPSQPFIEILQRFLRENTFDHEIGYLAALALSRLENSLKTLIHRTRCPSQLEFDSVKSSTDLTCDIQLPDSTTRAITVTCSTTIDQAILQLVEKFPQNFQDEGWGLCFLESHNDVIFLRGEDYFCDWLMIREEESKDRDVLGTLMFQPRFLEHLKIPEDEFSVNLYFHDAVRQVFSGKINLKPEDIIPMTSLYLQATVGKFTPANEGHISVTSLGQHVPQHFLEAEKKAKIQFSEKLGKIWKELENLSSFQAKLKYLETVKTSPYFGCTFFQVEMRKRGKKAILCFGKSGVKIMSTTFPREVQLEISWREINQTKSEEGRWRLVAGNIIKPLRISFLTPHSDAIEMAYQDHFRLFLLETNPSTSAKSPISNVRDRIRGDRDIRRSNQSRSRSASVSATFDFQDTNEATRSRRASRATEFPVHHSPVNLKKMVATGSKRGIARAASVMSVKLENRQ
eukprot:TRINITY_DN5985_c1_g1_i2.p1 TRINITY_DN5985_c1_g1~~TRINITY_DN5985_c1_g1_i2.p1  ORF type:complete len:2204 (+),score=700.78 TRINITY_DN5985_c1_g1_i2:993-6614(+)